MYCSRLVAVKSRHRGKYCFGRRVFQLIDKQKTEHIQRKALLIDGYIAEFSPEVQQLLQQVCTAIRAVVPDASGGVKYAIPTFIYHKVN